MNQMNKGANEFLEESHHFLPPMIGVLALLGCRQMARLASVGLAAVWLAETVRDIERTRSWQRPDRKASKIVDTSSEDSFPASDAPSYSGSSAGAPE